MKKGLAPVLVVLASVLAVSASAADLFVTWDCVIGGSLSDGGSTTLSGSVVMGADTIFDINADFVAPNAHVGDGTDLPSGTLTITCEIAAPDGYQLNRLVVDLIGSLIPGVFATAPQIAWTEDLYDTTGGGEVLILSDAGVDTDQPSQRVYEFDPVRSLKVVETFELSGVTYDDGGNEVIDDTAVASLTLVEKEVSLVPEPGSLSGAVVALGALAALRCRK